MKPFVFSLLLLGFFVSTIVAQPNIFVVRHAEKAAGGGDDPELSAAGRARAEALAATLKDAGITAIYETEFKRAQQTAAPLAKALGISATTVRANETAALVSNLRDRKETALVVGHGNTIPDLIKALGIDTPINIPETDYDNLFIVIGDKKPRLIRLHYR